jgi:hypothetical protein
MSKTITVGDCRFELLTAVEMFCGLGAVHIGGTQVRSGRLPLKAYTQTFTGLELQTLRLLDVSTQDGGVRLDLEAQFAPLKVKLLRDHSFDPIHETGDWDSEPIAGRGKLALLLRPVAETIAGFAFAGFSYHYEYESDSVPLFYILDMASWELEGDITGATAISQSTPLR